MFLKFLGGVFVPNIASAEKRVRVTEKRTLRNKSFNSALKTAFKKANVAVSKNEENRLELVRLAVKKIDQGVSKGIIHKNTANRKKSRLVQKYNFTVA